MEIFKRKYDGCSILGLSQDVMESMTQQFNQKVEVITRDSHGIPQGRFIVTVEYVPDTVQSGGYDLMTDFDIKLQEFYSSHGPTHIILGNKQVQVLGKLAENIEGVDLPSIKDKENHSLKFRGLTVIKSVKKDYLKLLLQPAP